MKKYTVVYGNFAQDKNKSTFITNYSHIECDPELLDDLIISDYGWANVLYIFNGHCEQTTD